MASPAWITGKRSTPDVLLNFRTDFDGAIRWHGEAFPERLHDVAHADVPEINHVMNHGPLGGSEGAFALALHGHLF